MPVARRAGGMAPTEWDGDYRGCGQEGNVSAQEGEFESDDDTFERVLEDGALVLKAADAEPTPRQRGSKSLS